MDAIAQGAQEVGLDSFATEPHHPPFVPSSTTTLLNCTTTLTTTNGPVRMAEDNAMLQHLADGRIGLVMGRGNTDPVSPWFGQNIRQGINLAVGTHTRREDAVTSVGCSVRRSSHAQRRWVVTPGSDNLEER